MEQVDAKSVKFLNAVRYFGGEANITEIRSLSGLSRNETNYRFNKLEEIGLIDVTKEPSPGNLPDRKVAHLTGAARRELERGLGSAMRAGLTISDDPNSTGVSRERFVELESELKALREAHRASIAGQKEIRELREDVYELQDYVFDWTETATMYLRTLRAVIEQFLPVDNIFDFTEQE